MSHPTVEGDAELLSLNSTIIKALFDDVLHGGFADL
jgi:hypothetical protein